MTESGSIRRALEKSGVSTMSPKGRSRFPYIKDTYTVVIERPSRPLEKYDCVLFFERENVYVLHRLLSIDGDVLHIMGDNNPHYDRPVDRKEIVGVLVGFYKPNGKYVEVYRKKTPLSVKFGCLPPVKHVRILFWRAVGKSGRIFKKIFGKKQKNET